jgi:iron complex outermembrane receptor protein
LSKRDGTTLNRCGSRSAWGAGANGNPPVAFGGDPRDINKAIANSFQSIVYKNCFNQGTVLPRSVGGQDWYSGGTVPDVNFGLYNVPGANNLSLNLPGVSQSDCNELGPGGCNFTGSAEQARLPNVARRVNNRDTWATRAILRWQPTTEMDWQLNVHGGRASPLSRQFQMIPRTSSITSPELVNIPTDNQGYADPDNITGCLDPGSNTISQGYKPSNGFCQFPVYGTNPEDGDPFAGDYNRTGRELLDLAGTSLTGEIYADNWRYRTISAFEWNQRSVDANLDGTPNIGIELGLGNEAWQLSEEVRAFWDGGGDFTAQLGGFFLYESLDVNNTFRLNEPSYQAEVPLPGNPPSTQAEPTVTLQRYSMQTYSASAYGTMSWEPSEYTKIDYKSMDLTTTLANFFTGGPLTGIDIEQRGSTSVDASGLSGDISINYKPVQDVNAYWKYSRGFKGPHINGGAIGTTKAITLDDLISPVGPESVNAIEVGLKTLLFDGRLRWNTALYYYDYTDIQIFQLKNAAGGVPVQQLVNAQDADIYGLETEVDVRPLEGWAPEDLEDLQLFASFGFNKSAYTNFVNVRVNYDSQGRPIPLTIDNSGNTLINAPEISFAGFAQWKFPVGNYGFLTPRFDWTYKSSVFFSPENLDDISQGAFWLFNLRLGFTIPDARIEVAAFVMNVANEVYRLDAINLSTFRGITLYAMGDPRTYGVAVSIEF